jgi:hypothetical protein
MGFGSYEEVSDMMDVVYNNDKYRGSLGEFLTSGDNAFTATFGKMPLGSIQVFCLEPLPQTASVALSPAIAGPASNATPPSSNTMSPWSLPHAALVALIAVAATATTAAFAAGVVMIYRCRQLHSLTVDTSSLPSPPPEIMVKIAAAEVVLSQLGWRQHLAAAAEAARQRLAAVQPDGRNDSPAAQTMLVWDFWQGRPFRAPAVLAQQR